jgi:hypothetical protein
MAQVTEKKRPFKASFEMKAGTSASFTAGQLVNFAPICLGAVVSGSDTVTPANVVGIRNGMNVAAALGLTANYTVSNLNTSAGTFTVSANATATSAATTLTFTALDLPKFDLSAWAAPGETIEINDLTIVSTQGAAAIKLAPAVMLYNTSAVLTAYTNAVAFTPSYNTQANYGQARIIVTSAAGSFTNLAASAYETATTNISRPATLDTKACLHAAVMDTNTYLYSSGETVRFTIQGMVR